MLYLYNPVRKILIMIDTETYQPRILGFVNIVRVHMTIQMFSSIL